ncbi:MAG: DUF1446 domain-containing protein [Planctomycetota bacterium]|nr:DUF1446 domain-containing protein [Planctomycetota bacterium]MDA1213402.1 DUF1446 domain-containing protein [Planctomycetota bacterium]
MKTIRIGNGAGFWGDHPDAPLRLAEQGDLNFLTLEYLAELTMSILAQQKSHDENAGYVTDFPEVVYRLAPWLSGPSPLKIVTNAGGMNPLRCAYTVGKLLASSGLGDISIAAVSGDDIFPSWNSLLADGETFPHLDTGESIANIQHLVVSANVYLGAAGIASALDLGADIVVTGRIADASLTVGPAMHAFDWSWSDWNRLAAATVAGHLIECGAQMTGGMFSDWNETLSLGDVGYPIAELSDDGSVVVTKPAASGGAVTVATVSEQLVYEIGDPEHYLTPDVDVDFSHVRLEQIGDDRVAVHDARGNPAPPTLKTSISYQDGYLGSGTIVITGPDAINKAQACAAAMQQKLNAAGVFPQRWNVEYLGAGDVLPGIVPRAVDPPEIVLRMTIHDKTRAVVDRSLRELVPLVTSGPPGVTGYVGGRAKARRVLSYWPSLIARDRVSPTVEVRTATEWCDGEDL